MNKLGIIKKAKTAFVLVDIQEKFIPVIKDVNKVISNSNILIKASEILKIPLVVTEQYPKGLGYTSKKIKLPKKKYLIEKNHFSCFDSKEFTDKIKALKVDSLVLFGIEAHVCILKTALDGLRNKFNVYVVADTISSRTLENKSLAIERMRQSGVFIVSCEMIIFQLLEKAGTEDFKKIYKLVK